MPNLEARSSSINLVTRESHQCQASATDRFPLRRNRYKYALGRKRTAQGRNMLLTRLVFNAVVDAVLQQACVGRNRIYVFLMLCDKALLTLRLRSPQLLASGVTIDITNYSTRMRANYQLACMSTRY